VGADREAERRGARAGKHDALSPMHDDPEKLGYDRPATFDAAEWKAGLIVRLDACLQI
jgi:hypothetical protein